LSGFLDLSQVRVTERIELKKFDGDVQDDEHLMEITVAEDGIVLGHWERDPTFEVYKDIPAWVYLKEKR
jgi:hypothetical protein